ncbi:uncharacterized protein SCHCODRAFT_02482940 [Schizophyllum commune H4-8]|uniref:Transmembrane protein n=1 Tax=Schizophyllum commune (strain H4-8 / FGSC 9210) TaxID=578458 RepID=D8PV85_SCHCM|nr:uncharacterized protein SCHCODRAFT_02482940 [Schizophyllum commune H4-8]KAI5900455.1 hypothetical protein SCHCODRAFT_02482940 [Schizophyllum commune H4-8]
MTARPAYNKRFEGDLSVTSFGGEGLSRSAGLAVFELSSVSSRKSQISAPQCDSRSVVHCAETLVRSPMIAVRPEFDPRASRPEMGPWGAHPFCKDPVVSSVGVVPLPEQQLTTFKGVSPTTPTKSTHKGINAWPLPDGHQFPKVFVRVRSLNDIASVQKTWDRGGYRGELGATYPGKDPVTSAGARCVPMFSESNPSSEIVRVVLASQPIAQRSSGLSGEDFDRFVVVVREGTNARTTRRALFVYNFICFCAWAWLSFIVTVITLLQTAHFWWPFFSSSSDM